ncbi:uncharacterized protein LOC134223173 [Armigeres subalbatus]|uniref:uncharacterized protein LOC134223173 n=1 Tax=Armigeres subalbatus TaxID=124917 RepID=UPI002ED2F0F3
MNGLKKTTKLQRSVTPSKIPLRSPSKEMLKPPTRILKPSSTDLSLTDVQPVVFDLNGRKVKTNPPKDVQHKTDSEAVSAEPGAALPCKELVKVPSNSFISTEQKAFQRIVDQEGELIRSIQQKFGLVKPPTQELMDILNSSIGDGGDLGALQKHCVFSYTYDEGDEGVLSSSGCCKEGCLEKGASRCSFMNVHEDDISMPMKEQRRGSSTCQAIWNVMSVVIILLLLAIILVQNYDTVIVSWNGYDWLRKQIPPEPEEPETLIEKMINFLLRFWVNLKDVIVLDDLEEELEEKSI